ncbi:MAG: hypothetical protein ABI758_01460 [Candidatus Woesebacteria bacterium]
MRVEYIDQKGVQYVLTENTSLDELAKIVKNQIMVEAGKKVNIPFHFMMIRRDARKKSSVYGGQPLIEGQGIELVEPDEKQIVLTLLKGLQQLLLDQQLSLNQKLLLNKSNILPLWDDIEETK